GAGGIRETEREYRRPNDDQLPLISFPWVLQPVLGKIANRHFDDTGIIDCAGKLATWSSKAHEQSKIQRINGVGDASHDVETAGGIQHAGEVLELFQEDLGFDPFDGLGVAFDQLAGIQGDEGSKETDGQSVSIKPNGTTPQLDTDQHFDSLIELDDEILTPVTPSTIESTSRRGSAPIEEQSSLLDISDEIAPAEPPKPDVPQSSPQTACSQPEENRENKSPLAKSDLTPSFLDGTVESEEMLEDEEMEEIMEEEGDVNPSAVSQLEVLLNI
ncbi:hypothetical protein FQN49_004664, partial [Arthroderma sp. PD_2]